MGPYLDMAPHISCPVELASLPDQASTKAGKDMVSRVILLYTVQQDLFPLRHNLFLVVRVCPSAPGPVPIPN